MPTGDWVRDEKGYRYQLKEVLGSGAIATVYRGRPEGGPEDGSKDVAVKVPHRLLSRELIERFWSEHDILKELYQKAERRGWGHLFPRAWRGYTEDGGVEVLLMELARGERLVALAATQGGRLLEELGLAAGLQYARLLQVLHDDAQMSCADRKPNDFYWQGDARTGKLMVLDWNVVRRGAEKNVLQDIYIFGRIWYELLLGTPPLSGTDRVGRDITAHPAWKELSYGTQAILRRALQPAPKRRHESAQVLADELQRHWDDWREATGQVLLERGQRALEEARVAQEGARTGLRWAAAMVQQMYAPAATEIESTLEKARKQVQEAGPGLVEALRLLELAKRKGAPGAEGWLTQAERLARERLDLLIEGCRQLELIQYSAAALWLEVAQEAVADDPPLRLRVAHWATLAQAGKAAIAAGGGLKAYLPDLTRMAGYLEVQPPRWRDVEEDWRRLEPRLRQEWPEGTEVRNLLASLPAEASFWRAWDQAVKDEERRQFDQAAEGYRAAQRELERVAYRDELMATLPSDIPERITFCAEKAGTEERVIACINEGKAKMEHEDFLGALDVRRRGLALAAGDRTLLEKVDSALGPEPLLSLLLRLRLAHATKAWDASLSIAYGLGREFLGHDQARRLAVQVVREALAQKEELERRGVSNLLQEEEPRAMAILIGLKRIRDEAPRLWAEAAGQPHSVGSGWVRR